MPNSAQLRRSQFRRSHRRTGTVVRAAAVGLAVAAASVACAQQREADNAMDLPENPPELRGTVGEPADLFGLAFEVLALDAFEQSPEGFPRLRLIVRSENTNDKMMRNPDVELWCDESEEGGDWYLGSTWEANALLPALEVNEGELYLGFPHKPSSERYSVPTCTNARVVVTETETTDRRRQVVNFPIEPELIEEAISASRGRPLPLPPRGE